MADAKELESAKRRTETQGVLPVVPFTLEPLPDELTRAFPRMKDWESRTNARIAEYVTKLNTTQQPL